MKLRSFAVLLLLSLFVMSCTSASKSFRRGQYDDAIARSIKILNRDPANQRHLEILKNAYRMANFNDQERILALKNTGQPDIWGRIVTTYERMIARNRKIEALPSSVKNEIEFTYESHSQELATARQRASEFHYAAGLERLARGTRPDARQAFAEFERVVVFSGLNFRDVRDLKARAEELGTTHVLFHVVNRSGAFLPHEAVWNLTNIQPQALNRRWIRFDTEPRRPSYHFEVIFTLDRATIFPISVNSRRFTESRTITEGTEFQTDSRGRPVLDSLGNPIRIPKTVTLRCTVTELTQQRRARLDGNVAYFDVENQRVIRTIFLNRTVSAHSTTFSTHGDLRALSDQTRRRITAPFIPLPHDADLLIWASRDMNELIRQTLLDNRQLIR